jgi:hypothetical protein
LDTALLLAGAASLIALARTLLERKQLAILALHRSLPSSIAIRINSLARLAVAVIACQKAI